MRSLLTAILLFLFGSASVPGPIKGCAGKYYIIGTAFMNKTTLLNKQLEVELGKDGKKWTVSTDEKGQFEISIPWMSACPSGLSASELAKENARLNPTLIVISYKSNSIFLTNNWKKYGKCFSESRDEITWKKDLHFE